MVGEILKEYEFETEGPEMGLIRGKCGHCRENGRFESLEDGSGHRFWINLDHPEYIEEQVHSILLGQCANPACRGITILYRATFYRTVAGITLGGGLFREEIIYPPTVNRKSLPSSVPNEIRKSFEEAARIEQLSPNGAAFICRRILETELRTRLGRKRDKLFQLIERFLNEQRVPSDLEEILTDIQKFGNIAGHPGTTEEGKILDVDQREATYLLDTIEELMDFLYVRPERQREMRARWEAKEAGRNPDRDDSEEEGESNVG